jgi:hypothetical protein
MMAMTGPLSFSGERSAGRISCAWRWFVAILIREKSRRVEHEVFEYLRQHDLSPELRIVLERQLAANVAMAEASRSPP